MNAKELITKLEVNHLYLRTRKKGSCMKIVETSKKTYLATEVEETSGGMSQLNGAIVIDSSDDDKETMAFKYLKATLLERVISVKVRTSTIESIEDVPSVVKLVEKLNSNMPEAKRRAEVKAVLGELSEMLDISYHDYDDD